MHFDRNLSLLSLTIFLSSVASAFFIYLPLYLITHLAYSVSFVGYILSCAGAGFVFGGYLSNYLRMSLSFTNFYKLSILILILIYSYFYYIDNYISIIFSLFLASTLNGALRPIIYAIIEKISPQHTRINNIALLYQMLNLGMSIGVFVGGWIAKINYYWLFIFCSFVNTLAFLTLFFVQIQKNSNGINNISNEDKLPMKNIKDINIYIFYGYVFFMGTCLSLLNNMYPIFLNDIYHMSKPWIGIILGTNGLLIGFFGLKITRYMSSYKYLYNLNIPLILMSFAFLMLPFGYNEYFALANIIIITFAEILVIPMIIGLSFSDNKDDNVPNSLIIINAVLYTPVVSTPYIGGYIYTYFGPNELWYLVGATGLLIALMLIINTKFKNVAL